MSALARWCFQHRLMVVGLWLAILIGLGGLTAAKGTSYVDDYSLPGSESSEALDLLMDALPQASGDTSQIVLHVASGTIRDDAVQQRVTSMLSAVESLPSVVSVTSPYGQQGAAQVSQDGRTAYASVHFDSQAIDLPREDVDAVIETAQGARGKDYRSSSAARRSASPPGANRAAPRSLAFSPRRSSCSSRLGRSWAWPFPSSPLWPGSAAGC